MISAVVHTYNEEKNLDRCLSSLVFADEIILIDMGSTDRTLEIANSHHARVFEHPYTGFVEPARNFGIKKAKGDWLLIVDADEEIPSALAGEIKKSVSRSDGISFYRLARKNIIFDKWLRHTGWWPDYQVRLFRKGTVEWLPAIHGIPVTKGEGAEIPSREDLAIIHRNYQSVEQYLDRLNRYTTIQAKEHFIRGTPSGLESIIGAPVNEFIRRFFMREGYRDGLHGLLLCLLQAFSELIVQIKLWQLSGFHESPVDLDGLHKKTGRLNRLANYWFADSLLKKARSVPDKLRLKILRKLSS